MQTGKILNEAIELMGMENYAGAKQKLDTLKIDDPVGAVPVHLFNGVFGTVCVGLFAVDRITGVATASLVSNSR